MAGNRVKIFSVVILSYSHLHSLFSSFPHFHSQKPTLPFGKKVSLKAQSRATNSRKGLETTGGGGFLCQDLFRYITSFVCEQAVALPGGRGGTILGLFWPCTKVICFKPWQRGKWVYPIRTSITGPMKKQLLFSKESEKEERKKMGLDIKV